jgi:hypothetical protein
LRHDTITVRWARSAVAGSAASDLHAPNLFSLGEPAQLSRSLGISRLTTFWTINAAKSHADLLATAVYREGVAIRYFSDWTGVKQLLGKAGPAKRINITTEAERVFISRILFFLPTYANNSAPAWVNRK